MSYLGSARSRFNRASTACIAAFPSEIPFAYALRLSWSPIEADRKSTRLNSSHDQISYAVFCLKKKKTDFIRPVTYPPNNTRHLDTSLTSDQQAGPNFCFNSTSDTDQTRHCYHHRDTHPRLVGT